MKKVNIEESLKRAINEAPLLDFEEIAKQPYIPMSEHDYITKQVEKKRDFSYKKLSIAMSFCILLLFIGTSWIFQYKMTDSIITLDVNPSVKIVTNRKDKVIQVKPLNDDGMIVVENLRYENEELNKVVKQIVERMYKEGYINLDKNTILVSADNKKKDKADVILDNIGKVIYKDLSSKQIASQVILQIMNKDKNITKLAKQYGISEGKMQFVQLLVAKMPSLSVKNLVDMTIDQLMELAEENGLDIPFHKYESKSDLDAKENPDSYKNNGNNKETNKRYYDEDNDSSDYKLKNKDNVDNEVDDKDSKDDNRKDTETDHDTTDDDYTDKNSSNTRNNDDSLEYFDGRKEEREDREEDDEEEVEDNEEEDDDVVEDVDPDDEVEEDVEADDKDNINEEDVYADEKENDIYSVDKHNVVNPSNVEYDNKDEVDDDINDGDNNNSVANEQDGMNDIYSNNDD